MGNVFPGYRGIVDIDGIGPVRFQDANISAKQEINAPDLIMGDWDHDAYNYGPITVGGSISGPVTETFIEGTAGGGLWDWAIKRYDECGVLASNDLTLYYYCNSNGSDFRARRFTGMYVNSLDLSCSAGDIAQFSLDLLGSGVDTTDNGWRAEDHSLFSTAEKLITWDKVSAQITDPGDEQYINVSDIYYSNFNITVSNNLTTAYALNQENLFPFEIVPGLRTITGSISVYNTPRFDGKDKWDDYPDAADVANLRFILAGNGVELSIDVKARFHRVEPASSTGNIVSTVAFTGVTHQLPPVWSDN